MKQIIIIGCPGSGKTYFAKQLSEILQIELFHMDNIYWKKDKTHISRGELISAVDRIISQSEWILDGNYISTIEQRIKGADTIFLFDYTTKDCLEGVKSRIGVKRDDIPWIETKLDPDFQKWIMDFRKDTLPQIEKILERYKYKKIIILLIFFIILPYIFTILPTNKLTINFIDVGQGDSTLITTPSKKKIIIDGGGSE